MRIGEMLWLPVRVVWAVIKACFIPAAITALAWWILSDAWAKWITIAMVVWAAIVLLQIVAKLSGHVRSLQRGPFYVRHLDDEWL
jgi:hypothetical protein